MVDYNTHGGYFAPQGLLKINVGGSHEENPNGGVQLGVDGQGVPNLVEEDEVVYKDFVYSDNIKADGKFLEENHLPKKYADKLYSEIAEALCDEIGEQTDPIALNGLNVMLGRLAEAQEAQKAAEEEAALMEELKNMSPEDIAAIQEALAQQAAAQQMPQEQIQPEVIPEMVAPEQIMPEQIPAEAPMMANGGFIRQYGGGGGRAGSKGQKALNLLRNVAEFISPVEEKEITLPDGTLTTVQYAMPPMVGAARNAGKIKDWETYAEKGRKLISDAANEASKDVARWMRSEGRLRVRLAEQEIRRLGGTAKKAKASKVGKIVANEVEKAAEATTKPNWIQRNWKWAVPVAAVETADSFGYGPVSAVVNGIQNASSHNTDIQPYDLSGAVPATYATGGLVNRFDWGDFMNSLNEYGVSRNPGGIAGKYKIDTSFPLNGYKNIADLENSGNYKAFTDFVLANPTNENILNYLRALDRGTNENVPKLFDENGVLRSGWDKLYSDRRYDKLGGIYHFSPDELPGFMLGAKPSDIADDINIDEIINMPPDLYAPDLQNDVTLPNRVGYADINVPKLSSGLLRKARRQGRDDFDVRLLSPLTDMAMGLANLATPADHYEYKPIRPYLPYGRMLLRDQRYMPIDMNMITNQMQAQNRANARAILNSGAGPSTAALINAADYNGALALGNALANVWQANNEERNRVIAANNQNAATVAQFDRDLDAQRAQILNNMAMYNDQNALRVALLNNQAEQDKYNAVAASVNSGKKFLNDYGWENMNRNMVNTDRSTLDYLIDRMNRVLYDPNRNSEEAADRSNKTLLKKYKKGE